MDERRPSPSKPGRAFTGVERRTQTRLRALIDDLKADIEQNRRELAMQASRMGMMQADIDALKGAARSEQRRPMSMPGSRVPRAVHRRDPQKVEP